MRFINRLAIALLLVTLAGTVTFAKSKRGNIKIDKTLTVNGMQVKPGSYDVVFDEAANELSIVRQGKVVAKTAVHLEQRDKKARDSELRSRQNGEELQLVSFTFGGSATNVVVGQAGMQVNGNN